MLRGSRAIVLRPAVANFEEHERNPFGWALLWLATLCALLLIIIGFAGQA